MSRASYWSKYGKERRRPRQNCYNRSSQYEETEYSLLQESDNEDIVLQPRKSELLLEKVLEPGDTLLSLSLQFNCPVAELKRINNILRDNEIFAHRTIRIPFRPGSVAAEKLVGVHTSAAGSKVEKPLIHFDDTISDLSSNNDNLLRSATYDEPDLNSDNSDILTTDVLNQNISLKPLLKSEKWATASSIINRLDNHDLLDIVADEGNNSPLLVQENPDLSEAPPPVLKCSGADWGLSWPQLVICSLLLGFAGPILYVLCRTEKHPK